MRFLADKLASLNIGWNDRPLGVADLHKLCRRFRITVQEMPLAVGGFYYRVMGGDFIAVDTRLSDEKKLVVLFHELGHFLFHVPHTGATASFHHVAGLTREEIEADVFALCAILPRALIERRTARDLIDDGHAPELVSARLEILLKYDL
jgi:Zn-dependent peptidase ImmA (M78 family)